MRKVIRFVGVVAILAGVAAAGTWMVVQQPEAVAWLEEKLESGVRRLGLGREAEPSQVVAYGFVEAEEFQVSAERGGRVVRIEADEGEMVERGQVLVQLDDTLHRLRIEGAKAELGTMQALLEQVRAGARPESLCRAEADAAQARAARSAAQQAWQDALAMLENPQELELALTGVRGELAVLRHQEEQARALAGSGQAARDLADETVRVLQSIEPHEWVFVGSYLISQVPPEIPLPPDPVDGEYYLGNYRIAIHDGVVTVHVRVRVEVPADLLTSALEQQAAATYSSWGAWTGLDQAEAARQGVESLLAELARQRDNPLSLEAQAHAAEAQYGVAAAAVELAESQVEGLHIGATPEQIASAQAQVDIALAAVQAMEVELEQFVVRAPAAGLVLERAVGPGEVVAQGAPLLTVADLDRLSLTVYLPEGKLGQAVPGDEVSVSVDAFPGRTFVGRVTQIASRAEFAPKNVQTQEERANLVFAVQVVMENRDGALKPGMPAQALFAPVPPTPAGQASAGDGAADPAQRPGAGPGGEGTTGLLTAAGSIEGEEIDVVSELGGKIERVLVDEADEVEAGEAVLELDARAVSAQIVQAEAAVAGAEAHLAQVKAGAHPAEILAARAAVAQARAEQAAAETTLRDMEAILQDPQELDAQIVQVRAAIDVAEAQVEQAQSQVAAAEAERDRYRAQGSLQQKGMYATWSYQVEAARASVEAAQAGVQAAREKLAALEAMREHPLAILSQVHAAQGRQETAAAGVAAAEARLDEIEAGPTQAQIRVAEAQVAQASAAVRLLEAQRDLLSLRSPIAGLVTGRQVHSGEVAVPGAVLLTVTNLDEVSLRLYVTVDRLGTIGVGQEVEVRVDSYPGEVFVGTVAQIAGQAEFAPSNVQTDADRAGMVIAVTVRLPNPAHRLRPGMPADAAFRGE